jgi:TonB family protein
MRALRLNFLVSTLLLVASTSLTAAAQSSDWELLRPDGEEFAVRMPKGSTSETGKELYHKMELNTRFYISQAPAGPVFAVVSMSGIKSNPALYTEIQRFNSYVDAFKTLFPPKLKGKTTPVKLTLVGGTNLSGNQGREYTMTVGDASGAVQTFITRRRFYAIAYLNPKKDDAVKEEFLSSFVLPEHVEIPATAAANPPQPAPAPEGQPKTNAVAAGMETPATASGETKPGEGDAQAKKKPISGGVLNGKAISLPKPEFPAEAKAAGVSGAVAVQVTVDEVGSVIEAKAVSGHPLLQQSAVAAAFQARFNPTSLMGEPVKVIGVLVFTFAKQ